MIRSKLFLGATLLLVACGDTPAGSRNRWPILPGAYDPLVVRISAAASRTDHAGSSEGTRAFLEILDGAGARAGPALVASWLDRFGRGGGTRVISFACWDEKDLPGAVWLSLHPDSRLDEVLLDLLKDGEVGFGARQRAVAALCRPGNGAARPALAARVLDRGEDPDVRRAILLRIDRIGGEMPPELGEMLARPAHDLDRLAAAVLALGGNPEAPSLVLEGLRVAMGRMSDEVSLFARAAQAIASGDAPVRSLVTPLLDSIRRQECFPADEDRQEATAEAIADELERWLDAHPEARDTSFERARAAYLASDRRRREEALADYDAVVAALEEDLDFAAAALAVTWLDEPWRSQCLARIDRLARVVKGEIAGLDEPRDILAVLADRLLPRRGGPRNANEIWPEREEPFLLWHVLRSGRGNCLGFTSLYLAVGERLGLPLHAVLAPGHVFVRWDDGRIRINVETTDGGREYPDEHYLDLGPGLSVAAEDAAAGHFLVNLTKRETVGLVCVNLSELYRTGPFKDGRGPALIHAERACELFPGCGRAWLARGISLFEKEPQRAGEALSYVARAGGFLPGSYDVRIAVAGIHLATGGTERALALYDEAIALAPERAEAREGRIRCLLRTGRFEDALAEAEEHGFRLFAIRARIFGGLGGWREALEALGGPRERPDLWMDVIDTLLVGDAFDAPEVDAAADLLDRLGWIPLVGTTPGNPDLIATGGDTGLIIRGGRARYEGLVERVDSLRPK